MWKGDEWTILVAALRGRHGLFRENPWQVTGWGEESQNLRLVKLSRRKGPKLLCSGIWEMNSGIDSEISAEGKVKKIFWKTFVFMFFSLWHEFPVFSIILCTQIIWWKYGTMIKFHLGLSMLYKRGHTREMKKWFFFIEI